MTSPRTVPFTVDGVRLEGRPGESVASAMVAAGMDGVFTSTYLGRPRGILTADGTEPQAFVVVHGEMRPATLVDVEPGLDVRTVAGRGRLDDSSDIAIRHDKRYVHADVVVVGGGPSGVAAAWAAGRSGARVVLATSGDGDAVGDRSMPERHAGIVRNISAALEALPETRVLTRSTVVGHYDEHEILIAQHRSDRRRTLWHVRARQVVFATGARQQPIVFADNDLPGIMLANAVRSYARSGALPARNVVVFTNDDSAYGAIPSVVEAGGRVSTVVDSRTEVSLALLDRARKAGVEVRRGSVVCAARGQGRLRSVRVCGLSAGGALRGEVEEIGCDVLAVSGGWRPELNLFEQAGGRLRWDPVVSAQVPEDVRHDATHVVGAAAGTTDLARCVADGIDAGIEASSACGFPIERPEFPPLDSAPPAAPAPLRMVPGEAGDPSTWDTHFVDRARDATVRDVWRAVQAGMRSVEHVKRYTTIGTGPDQGRTSAAALTCVLAELLDRRPEAIGATSARPPTSPVPIGLLAGRERGALHDPVRVTPMHSWHVAAGAAFEDVGQWKRAWYYPEPGEDKDTAVLRECRAARTGVAMMDATTLGKIDVIGPDAPTFLDRLYTNKFSTLPVGKGRYGMMCGADGMVLDDGVSMRLAEDHYLMSTTTGNAARVLDWLEEWLQTEWPDLAVHCTTVTDHWATIAVVGPDSRVVVGLIAPELDVSAESFRFMEFRDAELRGGVPARVSRISFSGELAFEINVASWFGLPVWEDVLAAGRDLGITPYGTETMHVLRAEKGFVIVGQDTDGTVTPLDLGMGWAVSKTKDFVGKRSLTRLDTAREDRPQLVGLRSVDPREVLVEGAQLVATDGTTSGGHVTSSYRSAVLDSTFALGLLRSGRSRAGEVVHAVADGRRVPARVVSPVFYDEEGERRDGR